MKLAFRLKVPDVVFGIRNPEILSKIDMKEWKAVRQSNEPYQEVVIHGCDYNLTDSELFAALRRVRRMFLYTRKMLILPMQVFAGIKTLEYQRESDFLLLAHCKSILKD